MFNKVILIGNLTRDVELRYTGSGSAVAKFGLAVSRTWKDRSSGEKQEEVCYVDINIFGRSAEIANQHLGKGRRILVEGRLTFEQWQDQGGQKRSKHSISAESFQFMDTLGGAGGSGGGQFPQNDSGGNDTPPNQSQSAYNSASSGNIDPNDDDIPF